jgi:epoxyqueuosine reductase QueG
MKEKITSMIQQRIKEYGERADISTAWGEPLVGFAEANHSTILNLKEIISPKHQLPLEVLPDASIVIVYFVPFTKELAHTNQTAGDIASPEWALAYEETNAMFRIVNESLAEELKSMGYQAKVSPETATFDQEKLISNWSQRHFARAAGLGTFGINNMLISKIGCCGRYSSIVTNLDVEPDMPLEEEYCLYKKNGRCGLCVKRCPSGALTLEGYDRNKCYQVLRKNAALYTDFGSSYSDGTGEKANSIGSEVCGKCVVNMPCSFFNRRQPSC